MRRSCDGDACLGDVSTFRAACARSGFARQARRNASPLVSQPNLVRFVKTEHAGTLQRCQLYKSSTSSGLSHPSTNSPAIALVLYFSPPAVRRCAALYVRDYAAETGYSGVCQVLSDYTWVRRRCSIALQGRT